MGFLSDALDSGFGIDTGFGILNMIGGEPERAADAQVKQAQEGVALQRQMFNTLREDAAPLRTLRDTSLPQLLMTQGIGRPVDRSQFMASPEYRQTYGAASSVADNLPGTAPPGLRNALLDRAGNLALGEYGNFYNRLANIGGFSSRGIGMTNSQLQGNIDAQVGLLNDAGTAAASGLMDAANARGNAAATGAGLLGAFLSDARTKEDIEYLGTDTEGNNVYEYSYKHEKKPKYVGYMAQEVAMKDPQNALLHPSGVLMVTEKYRPARIA